MNSVLLIIGCALVAVGAGLIYLPAGIIAGGGLLAFVGLAGEVGE